MISAGLEWLAGSGRTIACITWDSMRDLLLINLCVLHFGWSAVSWKICLARCHEDITCRRHLMIECTVMEMQNHCTHIEWIDFCDFWLSRWLGLQDYEIILGFSKRSVFSTVGFLLHNIISFPILRRSWVLISTPEQNQPPEKAV